MRIAPVALNAWVAGLFVTGSSLFALGSVPAYIHGVGARGDAATYAVGSVFFTAAALGQLVQAQDPALGPSRATQHRPVPVPRWSWRPWSRSWAAAASQLPGTIFFNVSTFAALVHNLTVAQQDRLVWRPDVAGSVLFLTASSFAILAVGPLREPRPRAAAWWAAWLNLVGSVAFMVSALGSYVLPSTGELIDVPVTVGGTFVGALCFLVGAALMYPAWRQGLATEIAPAPREGRP